MIINLKNKNNLSFEVYVNNQKKYIATGNLDCIKIRGHQILNKFTLNDQQGQEFNFDNINIKKVKKGLFFKYFSLEYESKIYNVYDVGNGYVAHYMVYDGDKQISEIVNTSKNIEIQSKGYILDDYGYLELPIIYLMLHYCAFYFKTCSKYTCCTTYSKTYSKNNKFYNKEWIKKNFNDLDFFEEVNNKK